jgi:hypothetical protein
MNEALDRMLENIHEQEDAEPYAPPSERGLSEEEKELVDLVDQAQGPVAAQITCKNI